jgi:putative hydrolase of the HAD superfamily
VKSVPYRPSPIAGLRDTILRLKKAGYKTAVLSDLPIDKKLSYLKLEGIWDCAFSSEETGYLKPHPSSFERLIKALRVPPEKIIYIGNNYRYDVQGARQLGIKTGLLSARSVRDNQADFHFHRFAELRRFLHALLAEKKA